MTARRSGEDEADFDSRVRARRPEPSDELLDRLMSHPRSRPGFGTGSLRLAGAVIFLASLAAALGAVGAFGYAGSVVRQDLIQVKKVVSAGAQTLTATPAGTQYRPGKGCGDKNHIHDLHFMCKITINDVTVKEGNSGTTPAVFTVSLSGSAIDPVTVQFATGGGTASTPSDYAATSGTLTFSTGQSVKTVTVLVVGDRIREPNETFSVLLSNASPNATIQDGQGVGTIKNDD